MAASPFRSAGDDQWILHACPDVGPSIVTRGSRLHIAWMSEGKNRPGIRFSYSDDGGESFREPKIVSGAIVDATHPVLVSGGEGLLLVFQGRASNSGPA